VSAPGGGECGTGFERRARPMRWSPHIAEVSLADATSSPCEGAAWTSPIGARSAGGGGVDGATVIGAPRLV
jgi:hypothetical protein